MYITPKKKEGEDYLSSLCLRAALAPLPVKLKKKVYYL